MKHNMLVVEQRSYHLPDDADLPSLKRAAERTAHHGDEFVDVTITGGAVVSVLVTPGLFVAVRAENLQDEGATVIAFPAERSAQSEWGVLRGAVVL